MTENLKELRKTAEAATPGPWHWAGNADNHQLYLATWIKGAGRCQVMDFERWGMQGAIPRFLDDESLMMQTAKNRLVFEVARNQGLPDGTPRSHPKVYRADVVDVMHPNAEFIATFDPPTVLALIDRAAAAEREAVAAKSVIAQHIVTQSFETSRTVGIAVDEAVRVVAKMLEADTDRRARDAEARAEAAEQAVDFHAQRDSELKTLLSMIADRLDEFCYDELASLIEDEPLNQWSEKYTSKLQAAEAAVQRVREVIDQLDDHSRPRTAHKFTLAKFLRRALDGGEQE